VNLLINEQYIDSIMHGARMKFNMKAFPFVGWRRICWELWRIWIVSVCPAYVLSYFRYRPILERASPTGN